MCHSGCYGPLPGSGHHSLPAPRTAAKRELHSSLGQDRQSPPQSRWEAGGRTLQLIFSGGQLGFSSRLQNDTPSHTLGLGSKPSPGSAIVSLPGCESDPCHVLSGADVRSP